MEIAKTILGIFGILFSLFMIASALSREGYEEEDYLSQNDNDQT